MTTGQTKDDDGGRTDVRRTDVGKHRILLALIRWAGNKSIVCLMLVYHPKPKFMPSSEITHILRLIGLHVEPMEETLYS